MGLPDLRTKAQANLVAIDPNSELVCIHDSARPLLLAVDVKKVLNDGLSIGAAVLGVPVKATIKEAPISVGCRCCLLCG
ncbi:hypothetical protein K1719_044820 [Acacia pycnantha]|nr:hypothetical protein K1719_044820 [Acacia pycnantha]